ncbi:MAG: AAA family ATPase [Alphaproteobacteria bacterium]|nr:AAA family ATPase [Alphaproteobacteria bacterium]
MASAIATAERASPDQAHFIAFCADSTTHAAVDRVVGDIMLPHASIRKGTVKDAIKYLSQHQSPKLLMVDITGSDLPLSDIDNLADVCEPGVSVIAIGERNDCGLFRDLMHHGVTDYLVKPLSPALLQKAISNISEHGAQAKANNKLGKLVAVMGARGGVGATTVATSLSWIIAQQRRRKVALLDLDLQYGTVALSLDIEPSHGLREALESADRIDSLFMDRMMTQHSDRLFVMSAEESPDETLLLDFAAVELLLNELRNKYHYVVVDLPRTTSPSTLQVLEHATDLILISDFSLAGMRDTMRTISFLPTLNASCNCVVVAGRAGEHKNGEMPKAEFEKGIGRKVDFVLPFDAKTVAAATNFGQPVAAGKGPVAKGLGEIADRLCGPAAGAELPRGGMLQKLLSKTQR